MSVVDRAHEPGMSKLLSSLETELRIYFVFQGDTLWRKTVGNCNHSEEIYFNINLVGFHYVFPFTPLSYLKVERAPPLESHSDRFPNVALKTVSRNPEASDFLKGSSEVVEGPQPPRAASLCVKLYVYPSSARPRSAVLSLEPLLSALASEEKESSWLLFSA